MSYQNKRDKSPGHETNVCVQMDATRSHLCTFSDILCIKDAGCTGKLITDKFNIFQFYPWFKFSFLLFQAHYHVIIIHYHTQKQKKRKFEPRIKLNHNIYIVQQCTLLLSPLFFCLNFVMGR